MKTNDKVYNVAVLVDTSSDWGRRIIDGIVLGAQKNGTWHIWIEPRGQNEVMRLPPDWRGDGVIARVSSAELAEHLKKYDVPVVNVSRIELPESLVFPRVTVDPVSSAKLAYDHFRRRGFWNFAYIEPYDLPVVQEHYRAFAEQVEAGGMECELYLPHQRKINDSEPHERINDMMEWIDGLQKPIAVYTWGSDIGRMVINASVQAGVSVPHEVSVLGADDDALLCNITTPSLSGVVVPARAIGMKAAELLEKLMSGRRSDKLYYELKARRINERLSTDTMAVADPSIVRMLKYLHNNFMRPITITDALKAVPMGRRTLELKFKKHLGHTPAAELRALRIAHAQKLLVETELSVQEIAELCGLSSYNYLSQLFKQTTGETPCRYRKLARHSIQRM